MNKPIVNIDSDGCVNYTKKGIYNSFREDGPAVIFINDLYYFHNEEFELTEDEYYIKIAK